MSIDYDEWYDDCLKENKLHTPLNGFEECDIWMNNYLKYRKRFTIRKGISKMTNIGDILGMK